jgi:hypothetical protein
MKPQMIITADLGSLRVFRVVKSETDLHSHLQAVADEHNPEAGEKISDIVTDQAGRFPRGGGANNVQGDLSAGERLHFEDEILKRQVRYMAERIDKVLNKEKPRSCAIALSPAVHRQILDALSSKNRGLIGEVVSSNLTKTEPTELLKHFKGLN